VGKNAFAHGVTISLHPLFVWKKMVENWWVEIGGWKLVGENAWVKIGG